jgi:outer membrane immunogenic protein
MRLYHVRSPRRLRPLLACATIMLLSTTAYAADLGTYRPARGMAVSAFDWTGVHVGLSAGYGFDSHDADYSYNNVPPEAVPVLPKSAELTNGGAFVGGAAGYDWQINGVVLGLEGDISWTNLGEHSTSVVPADPGINPHLEFQTDYRLDWFSTIRGRIGVPCDHLLVYGTGGVALADVSMNTSVQVGNSGSLVGTTEEMKVGWTAGGGAELALTDHVTVKAEVIYFDLGDVSLNAGNPMTNISVDVEKNVAGVIGRAGIGYKF